jgi:hypothetical protein
MQTVTESEICLLVVPNIQPPLLPCPIEQAWGGENVISRCMEGGISERLNACCGGIASQFEFAIIAEDCDVLDIWGWKVSFEGIMCYSAP